MLFCDVVCGMYTYINFTGLYDCAFNLTEISVLILQET